MKKLALRIVLGLLLLIIIAASIFYFKLNSIIKHTIERQATASLDLQTTLDSAHLSLLGGQLDLSGLQVSNPPGYSAPQILTLDDGNVTVKYGQLRDDPIHIPSLTLKKPRVIIEQSGGKFNFHGLVEKQRASKTPPDQQMKVIIDTLHISDASVVLRPGLPGLSQELTIPIPTVTLHNIGNADGNQNGAALKQIITEVVLSLVDQSGKAGNLPAELKAQLEGQLQQVQAELGHQIDQVTGQVQKSVENATNDVNKKISKESDKLSGKLDKVLGGGKDK